MIGASITTCKNIYNSNIYNISCTITSSPFTSLSQDDLETSLSLRLKLNIAAQNKFINMQPPNLLLQLPVNMNDASTKANGYITATPPSTNPSDLVLYRYCFVLSAVLTCKSDGFSAPPIDNSPVATNISGLARSAPVGGNKDSLFGLG